MESRRYEVTWQFDAIEERNPLRAPLRVIPPVAIFADAKDPRVVRFTFEGMPTIWLVDHATFNRFTKLAPLVSPIG